MTLNPTKIKDQFPFFHTHPDVVYLDSASTTQKPKSVIDTLVSFYTQENANAGRASYTLARKLSEKIEIIRTIVQQFLNAKHPSEIIFTFGATDGFNKIIHSIGLHYLRDGDEIIYCPHDHQSFILPWFNIQKILKETGKTIHLVPIRTKNTGSIDQKDLLSKITNRTRVINLTHIHNVYGTDNDIAAIKNSLSRPDIIVNVDATQSVGHIPVDVQSFGCDILSFSGHKMFAAQGCGVTYIASWLHDKIPPVILGGGGGLSLNNDSIKITDYTKAWESGTQNYAAILTLNPAIE
ncbi:MAG: aminotransferase class V-fold PLP-dependent enzyme, partial [Patescibacteria group bacterium]|nr:aminotransferase class V-fold PLP-dependent enzyme [Patescibacteria group bacterium]